eukprot:5059667-Karenia_brevis.AAC.1
MAHPQPLRIYRRPGRWQHWAKGQQSYVRYAHQVLSTNGPGLITALPSMCSHQLSFGNQMGFQEQVLAANAAMLCRAASEHSLHGQIQGRSLNCD